MKQTVTLSSFRDAFFRCNRGEQFSYEALGLIFDYIEDYENDTGEEVELDVISICCDWAEDTPEAIAGYYDIDLDGVDEDDITQVVIGFLCDNTTAYEVSSNGTIVYVASF